MFHAPQCSPLRTKHRREFPGHLFQNNDLLYVLLMRGEVEKKIGSEEINPLSPIYGL